MNQDLSKDISSVKKSPSNERAHEQEIRELKCKLYQAEEECTELKAKQSHMARFFQMLNEKAASFEKIIHHLREQVQVLRQSHAKSENQKQAAIVTESKLRDQIYSENQKKAKEWESLFIEIETERVRLLGELREVKEKVRWQDEHERHLRQKITEHTQVLSNATSELALLKSKKETLEADLTAARLEVEKCMSSFVKKEQENTGLKLALKQMNQKLDELAAAYDKSKNNRIQLRQELERLRNNYPLRDLIRIKETQIAETQKDLEAIPKTHPQRVEMEKVLSGMLQQKEALGKVASEIEKK